MSIIMIEKEEIDYAVYVDDKRCYVYKKKKYKSVNRFFSSSEAIQYARENRYGLIVSIIDKEPKRWLIMEEVVKDGG